MTILNSSKFHKTGTVRVYECMAMNKPNVVLEQKP